MVLKPEKRPVPQPGPGEILIRVRAAGVNRPDVFQRMGAYPPPPGASDLPGLEAAGTVAAVGEGARRWSVGDEVTALTPGGGYAEYCLVHESNALPVPFLMAFSILSLGMLTALPLSTAMRRRGLNAGSPPPILAATVISLAILENAAPRFSS